MGGRRRATVSFSDRGDGLAGSHTEPHSLIHPNGYAACRIVLAGRRARQWREVLTTRPIADRFLFYAYKDGKHVRVLRRDVATGKEALIL
jgi:hypothetical protein